jgi:NAD(P)H-nitrite reductase large subunit
MQTTIKFVSLVKASPPSRIELRVYGLHDTNDRFLWNIQRNDTFSFISRISGGEITPHKLVVIRKVTQKYDSDDKIMAGQRIHLLGANKGDLPHIRESGKVDGRSNRV